MTAGAGGWRVAIVDTADDMNDNAANALLKMLEEPPARAMLLLLSNTPGRLLPTIRSRCQRLDLRPLDDAALDEALKPTICRTSSAARTRVAGAAFRRLDRRGADTGRAARARELAAEADRLIDKRAAPDIAGAAGAGRQAVAHPRRAGAVRRFSGRKPVGAHSRRARIPARADLERWMALLARLEELSPAPTACNLEPRQTLLTAARDLSARRAGRGVC